MIILTKDGSHTIQHDKLPVTYHSIHGAIQESMHVFILAGLEHWLNDNYEKINQPIRIFEMGFGTGLNALLSFQYALGKNITIDYTTVEKFPIDASQFAQLNYTEQLHDPGLKDFFIALHESPFDQHLNLHQNFRLHKLKGDLEEILQSPYTEPPFNNTFDIIFYDAFAPSAQPELWTPGIFSLLFNHLSTGGLLTTYCSKGIVRRAMQSAGFSIEKIPGPPGKREIVRASRLTK